MGKRIIQQARGRGSHTYKVRRKAFRIKLSYPRHLEGEGEVLKLINSSGHSSPLAKIKYDKGIFFIPAFKGMSEGDKIKFVGFGFRITDSIIKLKFKVSDELDSEADVMEKNYYTEGWNFKLDPEKSLSAQVKRMLSFIPKVDSKGNIMSNSLGYQLYENYTKVFNLLSQELAQVPLNEMSDTLLELGKNNKIVEGVLEELDKLTAHIK